jgi:uncharacterized phosphosugar-binding protein
MNTAEDTPAANPYYDAVRRLQAQVIESQTEILNEIAAKMAEAVRRDRRIFLFGTGHSHLLAEEAFFRAGGLAAATPMFVPQALMLHESSRMSSQLERMPELAAVICDEYDPQPGEMLIVYADSGSNALPVQMAIEAKSRGLTSVGVCSMQYAHAAPLSKAGKKLFEVSDFTIDNGGIPGDALIQIEGSPWRTAGTSTLMGVLIWNCLLSQTVRLLVAAGAEPPIFASYNMPGAIEHNQRILAKWSRINPHLPAQTIKSNT